MPALFIGIQHKPGLLVLDKVAARGLLSVSHGIMNVMPQSITFVCLFN